MWEHSAGHCCLSAIVVVDRRDEVLLGDGEEAGHLGVLGSVQLASLKEEFCFNIIVSED